MLSNPSIALTAHQFFDGLCWPHETAAQAIAAACPTPDIQAKTVALWQVWQSLMVADSGWPADQPQTPAALLPYLSDEVEELLEALHTDTDESPHPVESPRLLSALTADWLWAIAASSLTGMKLLEGVAADVHALPQAYGLRLVPTLKIHCHEQDYVLDLTTQSWGSLTASFSAEATIQLLDLPDAPILSAAALQNQIRDRAIALVPALHYWFTGVTVDLQLPGTPWTTAQAQLVLHLVPLSMQVVTPSPLSTEILVDGAGPTGLPTARVWQAAPAPTAAVETTTATLTKPDQPTPWTLDTELRLVSAAALTSAVQTAYQWELSRLVAAWGRRSPALTPLDLLTAVMQAPSAPEQLGLTIGDSPLSLLELCHQVKWQWLQANQEHIALMSGRPTRHLRSGQGWQSGTLVSQGQLQLLEGDRAIAALDVATAGWTSPQTDLEATDQLHMPGVTEQIAPVWQVDQLTQHINRVVQARSPLLASLNAGHAVKLWSPHDDLFPEIAPPELCLRWQVALRFFPSLP